MVTYAAVIRCEALHSMSYVRPGSTAGFDLSYMNGFRQPHVQLRRSSKDWGFMLPHVAHTIVAGPYEVLRYPLAHGIHQLTD